ncbi:MAG: methanogenesis marker 7 protein, partial [Methanophagales archaeon]|nr:methanogenesis marker 7 protein [Methanophagales archaeon]
MSVYRIMMFEGGLYRFSELKELLEDIGCFILQEISMAPGVVLHLAFPEEEEQVIREKIKLLGGKFKELPLAGAEIAIIAPSLGAHHAVNPLCDITEFLRREGAIAAVMGLARGVGKRIAQMTVQEKRMLEEFDAVVFLFGCFKDCIEDKERLCAMLDVPYLIVGGPPTDAMELGHYVGGIGRKTDRMRRRSEIDTLKVMAAELGKIIDEKRAEIEEDPLAVSPLFIKDMIEKEIPPKAGEELQNIIHLDGLRVNIAAEDVERMKKIEIGKKKLSE